MPKKLLLSSHQPVYLPWLGFFHKLEVSDLFVVLDNVPYSRFQFYNRNKINSKNGPIQLSVPVTFTNNQIQLHNEVLVSNNRNWQKKHWISIEQSYAKSPYFYKFSDELHEIFHRDWILLIDLNMALIKFFMRQLNINTKIVMASDYNFFGKKSNLLLDMACQLEADSFIFGKLGRDYADIERFIESGVAPLFQDYIHPSYTQYSNNNFEPYLSVLDLLSFQGPKSFSIMIGDNTTRIEYLEQGDLLKKGIIKP